MKNESESDPEAGWGWRRRALGCGPPGAAKEYGFVLRPPALDRSGQRGWDRLDFWEPSGWKGCRDAGGWGPGYGEARASPEVLPRLSHLTLNASD